VGEILRTKLIPFTCVKSHPSPNHGPLLGTGAKRLLGVVLHATAGSDKGAVSWMQNPASQASAQVHIDRDGTTVRLVDDNRRAWHAGRSEWRGESDVNSIALGWEIGNLNDGREPYTDLQYGVLAQMAAHYVRQGLSLEDFGAGPPLKGDYTSHAHVARPVGRKTDPLAFDWARFRRTTLERLGVLPVLTGGDRTPLVVWSDFFGENLYVTEYVSDREWYFVRESAIRTLRTTRAASPLSKMPDWRP
jgi:hypothetical protein